MSKINYEFNPNTLSFDKIERNSFKHILKQIIPRFLFSVTLGIFIFLGASQYIDSPAELKLEEQNADLLLNYDILNKELDETADFLTELQNRDDNVYRMIFQAKPIPESKRKAGYGGSERYNALKKYTNAKVLISTSEKLDNLSKKMLVQSESFQEIADLVSKKEEMAACIPAIKPISNKELTRFGSPFGMRMHPIKHRLIMHTGIDLTAPTGTPIHAPGDGIVVRAEHSRGGYGNSIRIDHGFGYMTLYGHCSKILVRPGQKVKRGDIIGLVGSTGLSTAPHLHYEVRINGKWVNPVNFYYDDLTDEEYEKMIEMSAGQPETHIFE